jgi:RimJ/RimL family protein N-acetyltransferase
VQLTSRRLVLREFVATDLPAVHSYASDPSVTRFMVWGPNDVAATKDFLTRAGASARRSPRTEYVLAVTLGGRVIGGVDLSLTDGGVAEVGYVLHRDFWSHGYATEATRTLLRWAVEALPLQRITGTCDPDNVASARVLEKAGLRYERRISDHLVVRGSKRDSLLYAVESDQLRR